MIDFSHVLVGFESLKFPKDTTHAALSNLKKWCQDERLKSYLPYIEHMVDNRKWELLLDSFYRMIPFGTGGRRGAVGAGPNRINPQTVALSIQGHCRYMRDYLGFNDDLSVVIAYDVRIFKDIRNNYPGVRGILSDLTSKNLARLCAGVYAAAGIKSYLVDTAIRDLGHENYISTPELSFLVRELGANGGLNVSASHNHPDDNGSKFYNDAGAQEIPPHDERLLQMVEQVDEISAMPFGEAAQNGMILGVPAHLHQQYLDLNKKLCPTRSRKTTVAFTPLSGTGTTSVGEALDQLGFQVALVEEQGHFDGTFENVKFRVGNPEVPQTLDLLEKTARERNCCIGLATDPDADRLGLIAREKDGSYRFFSGNEIGALILQSILSYRRANQTLPSNPIFVNTIVTTSLQRRIAQGNGCQVVGDLSVGFKYMGEVLGNLERFGAHPGTDVGGERHHVRGRVDDFIFATEEALGFLLSPKIRDKDACGVAVHLCGLAEDVYGEGRVLSDLLYDIYRAYGYYKNDQRSLVMEGIIGRERIARIQERLRRRPPKEINGLKVLEFIDFQQYGGPIVSETDRSSRNILIFTLASEDKRQIRVIIRPSGTEPKTKVYVEVPSGPGLGKPLDELTRADLQYLSDDQVTAIIKKTDREAAAIGDAFIEYALSEPVLGVDIGHMSPEFFLIPDLVPVDRKLAFCNNLLPELARRVEQGCELDELDRWLGEALAHFGKDYKALFCRAASRWCEHHQPDDSRLADTVYRLFK